MFILDCDIILNVDIQTFMKITDIQPTLRGSLCWSKHVYRFNNLRKFINLDN